MIDVLPDDLVVQILMHIPIKDAVATMILSKRWRYIWTMLPKLKYKESDDVTEDECKSIWHFLDKSLQLHKAPVIKKLHTELGPRCPVDVDVGKWITNAVDRKVCKLTFQLKWAAKPIKLPKSLYTCSTLVSLVLCDKICVDIISPGSLPSLSYLCLLAVVFKDESSLVGLLSSCPILKGLKVVSNDYQKDSSDSTGSLMIDSLTLKTIFIYDYSGDAFSIENRSCLDAASIYVLGHPDYKTVRSFSSLRIFDIYLNIFTVGCCITNNFSRLIKCIILPYNLNWLEPLMILVQNSPKLKVLVIDGTYLTEDFPVSWNHPDSVPKCLLTHLEIFDWRGYRARSEEKELVRYILANSSCLKVVAISMRSTCSFEDRERMMNELKSMSRISEPIIMQGGYIEQFTINPS
ncbi:hypothetical protein HID58_085286 [Brassica napus]|uniref:(rape) hypothetical protein n=2 Tax=Brassica napus TaxID=3708 RepID=A0A816IT62_BRANA|nr:hypothetical protein HID58_085286 [Brassica napus]CAF1718509.1 unnamed protein product [Brassica napus]